jgi:hypothetical protein
MKETSSKATRAFSGILLNHQRRYPLWQVQDIYKLAQQAAMGSEHALNDEDAVRAWLERELEEMGCGPEEALIDPIAPDGSIVRLHLRPYLAGGGDPETLLAAFLQTARQYHGSRTNLEEYLETAVGMTVSGELPFSQVELSEFFSKMQRLNYPAQHHSAGYEAAYRPAYRVIYRSFLPLKE